MALPSGYKQIEYIESDNSAWLDTGITMEKTDTVTLEAVFSTAGTSDVRYFGANGYMQIAVTSGGYSINGTAKKALGTKDAIKCTYTPNTESLYVNNSLIDTNDWSSYNGVAVKIGLFKMGDASNGWFSGKAANGKLYGATITKNGVTVRVFIPCKNAAGIAGMWDEISSTFFQSASSFAFAAPLVDLTAHKTLVGGTAYTVQGGKCMVGGTVYNILKGRTLIDGTAWDITFPSAIEMPAKGDLITMNLDGTDRLYRVLKIVDGTTVEVLGMFTVGSAAFSNSGEYNNGALDQYLNTTWLNTLSSAAKKAIVPKYITQYMYTYNSLSASMEHTSYANYSTKQIKAAVGNKYVYAIDVEDVEMYFGGTGGTENNKTQGKFNSGNLWEFFFNVTATFPYWPWLRSSTTSNGIAYIFDAGHGIITNAMGISSYYVQPAFQIDLSKIDFTIGGA